MADDAPVALPIPPDPAGDGDWGEIVNAAFREIESRINVLRQYVLDNPGGGAASDADVADLVQDLGSLTRAALDALISANVVVIGPGGAAAYNHNHDGSYATPAQVNALIAAAQAGFGTGISGAPAVWPAQFPPTGHTHTVAELSNASAIGRSVVTAVDGQAIRSLIGAGTGNGTSNLTIGTTSTTAAAGNHNHPAGAVTFTPTGGVTATNVQDAIAQAATLGSTGGGGTTVDVLYSGGAYPAQAASPPSGVKVRRFYGPVQPTVATWSGVLDVYEYAALT